MLRSIFVLAILAFGIRHALRGPLYAVLLYLWLAYFRPQEWLWSDWAVGLNLSLIAGYYAVAVGVLSGRMFRLDGRLALLLLLLAHSLASTLASPYADYAWPYWVDFLKSSAITYLLAVLVTDLKQLRLVFLVIALSLGFEAAKQGWGQLIFIAGEKNYNDIPFLGDNNGVAVGMFMLVPLIVALYQTSSRRWAKPALLVLLLGCLYRGISTFSRGGLLGAAAMSTMYLLRSRRKLLAMSTAAVIALAIGSVMSEDYWNRIQSIQVPSGAMAESLELSADEMSSLSRLHFWQVALDMAQARPLLGVGLNAYLAAYDSYDSLAGAYGARRSVHSSWLGILAELGFPGFLLFCSIFSTALFTCWRVRRRAKKDMRFAEFLPYATAIEAALVTFAVGGAFVIFQYTEMLWHFLGLSIALHRIAAATAARPATAADPPVRLEASQRIRGVA